MLWLMYFLVIFSQFKLFQSHLPVEDAYVITQKTVLVTERAGFFQGVIQTFFYAVKGLGGFQIVFIIPKITMVIDFLYFTVMSFPGFKSRPVDFLPVSFNPDLCCINVFFEDIKYLCFFFPPKAAVTAKVGFMPYIDFLFYFSKSGQG